MAHRSLLDTESEQPDDNPPSSRAKAAAMNELITAVEVIKSNYATKEDLAGAKEDLAIIKANYTTREDLASVKEDLAIIMANYTTRDDLAGVKEDLAIIKANYTTKEDLASTKEDIVIIKSNCTTKEELAIVNGKIDVLTNNQQALQASLLAFQTHAMQTFATKAELADAVYQLTWRMAGFAVVTISAMAAFVRYL